MKTDDLIDLLANQLDEPEHSGVSHRFVVALLVGLFAALTLMAMLLGLRLNTVQLAHSPFFWARLAFPCALGTAALGLTLRLSRPGLVIRRQDWGAVILPVLLAWVIGGAFVAWAPAEDRLPLLLGHSWKVCPIFITGLSVPAFAALIWAVRGLAPVRLRLTGAAAGLLAGTVATIVYGLHCPELSPSFWSVWYLLGMMTPGAIGAAFGPRLLRW
jgi:hypothetical protein